MDGRWILRGSMNDSSFLSHFRAITIFEWVFNTLQEVPEPDQLLTLEEALFLTWCTNDAVHGWVHAALDGLERSLLPAAPSHGNAWHSFVLLWSALLSIYACDAPGALRHVRTAAALGDPDNDALCALIEGMACRLEGNVADALRLFNQEPEGVRTRIWGDWRFESQVLLDPSGVPEEAIAEAVDDWRLRLTTGVMGAALYRLARRTEGECPGVADALLAELDTLSYLERPLVTTLIEDIAPRPLRNIVRADE